ncbi:MAG: hypothetical protein AAFW59_11040 [Pseudomonadota bacterium]
MDENSTIRIDNAYRAMFEFVEAYWKRGGQQGEIGSMLGDIQFGKNVPTETADPAQWHDWLAAVEKVTK